MEQGGIPDELNGFNNFFRNLKNYLSEIDSTKNITRGEILGMTSAEVSKLLKMYTLWYSGNPKKPGVYELHPNLDPKSNKPHEDVEKIMNDFKTFFHPLLNIMAVNHNLNVSDRIILNII